LSAELRCRWRCSRKQSAASTRIREALQQIRSPVTANSNMCSVYTSGYRGCEQTSLNSVFQANRRRVARTRLSAVSDCNSALHRCNIVHMHIITPVKQNSHKRALTAMPASDNLSFFSCKPTVSPSSGATTFAIASDKAATLTYNGITTEDICKVAVQPYHQPICLRLPASVTATLQGMTHDQLRSIGIQSRNNMQLLKIAQAMHAKCFTNQLQA
jgi:hypothetical protein